MSPDKKAHWKQNLAQSRMQLRTLLMSLGCVSETVHLNG
jgi:hypothetical protein